MKKYLLILLLVISLPAYSLALSPSEQRNYEPPEFVEEIRNECQLDAAIVYSTAMFVSKRQTDVEVEQNMHTLIQKHIDDLEEVGRLMDVVDNELSVIRSKKLLTEQAARKYMNEYAGECIRVKSGS